MPTKEKKEEKILYVGIDESNNGNGSTCDKNLILPIIYVAIFSFDERDVRVIKNGERKLSKVRKNFRNLEIKLGKRKNFSILLIKNGFDYKFNKEEKIGRVTASLVYKFREEFYDVERIEFYVDGEYRLEEVKFAEEFARRMLKKETRFYHDAHLDTKMPLVNLADELARYLYKKRKKGEKDFYDKFKDYLAYLLI